MAETQQIDTAYILKTIQKYNISLTNLNEIISNWEDRHQRKLQIAKKSYERFKQKFHCPTCDVYLSSNTLLRNHNVTPKHLKRVALTNSNNLDKVTAVP